MKVEKFLYNDTDDLCANTYVVYDERNNAVVIDPSSENGGVAAFIKKHNLNPKAILLTHGHFDHIKGIKSLLESYQLPVYIHPEDEILLTEPRLNGSMFNGEDIIIDYKVDIVNVMDQDKISLLDEDIKVIHTPFHTKGCICFYLENSHMLFSGDTLFKMSVGRMDLPTSTPKTAEASYAKLKALPVDTKVYPGHGPNTTIGMEISFNRFLNY